MNKNLLAIAMISLTTLSSYASADEVIMLSATSLYSIECQKAGGVSYMSADRGRSWSPINIQEMAHAAEHSKGMLRLSASMNGQSITKQAVDDYVASKTPDQLKQLEPLKLTKCVGGTVNTNLKTQSVDKATNSNSANLPFIGRRSFNFYGGSGTGETLTIQKDGKTSLESVGTQSSEVEYSGPFQNPLNIPGTDTGYYIENNEIFLTSGGETKTGCSGDAEATCSSTLYKID